MDSRVRDTQRRSPCTSLENAARMETSVPSMVAFSSVGGVPLELMAPALGSAFLCAGGFHVDFHADPQWRHPHRCEPSVKARYTPMQVAFDPFLHCVLRF
ncbi:unnamed protein product, partial [Staurois parvus]